MILFYVSVVKVWQRACHSVLSWHLTVQIPHFFSHFCLVLPLFCLPFGLAFQALWGYLFSAFLQTQLYHLNCELSVLSVRLSAHGVIALRWDCDVNRIRFAWFMWLVQCMRLPCDCFFTKNFHFPPVSWRALSVTPFSNIRWICRILVMRRRLLCTIGTEDYNGESNGSIPA